MRKAIVVGINDYPDAPLQFCVNDATDMAALLQTNEYQFDVTCILDRQATTKTIRETLQAGFSTAPEVLLFYFAGHGTSTDLGGFLDTVDADTPEDGLPLDYLRKLATVRLASGGSLIYALDCCHAGILSARQIRSTATALRSDDLRRELVGMGSGRVVLAACREHELANETRQYEHGVFTHHLLEGLYGYAADGSGDVTVMSLYEYVSRRFKTDAAQKPVFSGDLVGRIVLGTGFTAIAQPGVNIKTLVNAEADAEEHLKRFHADLSQLRREPDRWRTEGFRRACTSLESIMRWFDGNEDRLPGLAERQQFKRLKRDLAQRHAELGYLTPGTIVAEGEAEEQLGRGNFGAVWLIRNTNDRTRCLAYKAYHPHDLDDEAKVSRFERGFHAMERLDHPRIVRVHYMTKCPYGYFMDYIPGPNLRRFAGTFDQPADTVGLLITIAETLQHAHGRGVVHRDIKPENVLMAYEDGRGWRAYLTDFDLAWFSTATQITQSALGSTYYASPEQIDKPGSVAARAKSTDMYSFGQLMYFVVVGGDPPRDGSLQALKARIHEGWSVEPAERLVRLFGRCVEVNPVSRPSEFRAIAEELVVVRALLQGHDPNAHMTEVDFVREVAFALAGLEAEVDVEQNALRSLSGKVRIVIDFSYGGGGPTVECVLHCLEAPSVPGTSHQRMREVLMARIDRALRGYPGTDKKAGNQLPFQVKVTRSTPLTRAGAMMTASLVGSVIDSIEGLG
jgi:hypothetical protein